MKFKFVKHNNNIKAGLMREVEIAFMLPIKFFENMLIKSSAEKVVSKSVAEIPTLLVVTAYYTHYHMNATYLTSHIHTLTSRSSTIPAEQLVWEAVRKK